MFCDSFISGLSLFIFKAPLVRDFKPQCKDQGPVYEDEQQPEISIFITVLTVNSKIHSLIDLFTQSLYLTSTGFLVCSPLDIEVS